MRHEHLEHHRPRVEPFEVVGPAKFIASILGWSHDGFVITLEDHLMFGRDVEVLVGDERKPAVIVAWEVFGYTERDATFKVKFHPVHRAAPQSHDPWIKVGTTTIDGTLEQVARLLDAYDAERAIDAFMKADGPWIIGGRHLIARGSHVNVSRGTALIRCDIVRRQSEIDAEQKSELLALAQEVDQEELADYLGGPTCPECGPHGNRGEVLLASSWARCTTCAGGKPGDLWGEVQAEANPPTGTVRRSHDIDPRARRTMVYFASGRSETYDIPPGATSVTIDDYCETVEFDVPVASSGSNIMAGFKVPTKAECENYQRARLQGLASIDVLVEGDRILDKWGRSGTVEAGLYPPLTRIRMDEGWSGYFSRNEIACKVP